MAVGRGKNLAEVEVKHVDVWSVAKMAAGINAVFGFFLGILYGIEFAAGRGVGMMGMMTQTSAAAGAVALVVLVPIFSGIVGLVVGVIGAVIYNWLAGFWGGIKFKTK